MPEILTMASIRERFPTPEVWDDKNTEGITVPPDAVNPPCYCVGGAFELAMGSKWRNDDGTLNADVLFPLYLSDDLVYCNANLDSKGVVSWRIATEISLLYSDAITGANDQNTLVLPDTEPELLDDHFELAWQLLDDALTFSPTTFDDQKELRLLRGLLLNRFNDKQPCPVGFLTNEIARYRELQARTQKG